MFFLKHILLILVIFLVSCDSFKRFDQETYNCLDNKLLLSQINILRTNAIKKSYVNIANNEMQAEVVLYNKKEIVLSLDGIYININRDILEVSVKLENKLYFLSCEVKNFKM